MKKIFIDTEKCLENRVTSGQNIVGRIINMLKDLHEGFLFAWKKCICAKQVLSI